MDREEILTRINELVEKNRERCLWFLRRDYVPDNDRMRLKVLEYIQRHGDRAAALEAARLTRWLSPASRDTSASY